MCKTRATPRRPVLCVCRVVFVYFLFFFFGVCALQTVKKIFKSIDRCVCSFVVCVRRSTERAQSCMHTAAALIERNEMSVASDEEMNCCC